MNSLEADSGDVPCIPKRACQRLTSRAVNQATVRAVAPPSAPNDTGGLTPSTCPGPNGSARDNHRHAVARRTNFKFKKITTQARIIVRAKSLVAPALCTEPSRPNGRQPTTWTRGERTSTTRASESNLNDTEPQPTERLQPATPELPLAVLWARWRQAEPDTTEDLLREQQHEAIDPFLKNFLGVGRGVEDSETPCEQ